MTHITAVTELAGFVPESLFLGLHKGLLINKIKALLGTVLGKEKYERFNGWMSVH